MQLMQANTLAVMSRTDSATDVRRGNEGHRQAAAHWSTLTQTEVHHRLKLVAVAKDKVLLGQQKAETLSRSRGLTKLGKNKRRERSFRPLLFFGHLAIGHLQWLQVLLKPKAL